jgi:ElaB/YqjD/DUF883 family membrane-anchored ribosome-binding protein
MADQAKQQAVKHLLETAQRIRDFKNSETYKIARDLENSAYTLNQSEHIPTEEPINQPSWGQLALLIASAVGFIIGVILIKRASKK